MKQDKALKRLDNLSNVYSLYFTHLDLLDHSSQIQRLICIIPPNNEGVHKRIHTKFE